MPPSSDKHPNTEHDIVNDKFARGIIRRKTQQIILRPGLSNQDAPAIEQTILTHLIEAMRSFDPAIAHRNVFITTVVERFVMSYLKKRLTQKAGPGYIQSLNIEVIVPGELPTDLQYTLDESIKYARLQIERRPDDELRELVEAMAAMIATLPEPWQRMLELRKSHSMVRVSELMGVPRSTLNGWLRAVAEKFEQAGLRDYLA
ncbi:hypothetical protein [Novipirellula artificiosorum]|uniref:RNA polymerase sigma factor n=1 Tax=Novipirellula artificiosorum TaxID=2528016 RepID=A0A5C6DRH0_9BACT|nr:hypothetical protein [Novipirellula artificiosorum]TWU39358.1 hypothetical protein Poly41_21820 [Novipirellula artificiosorum]